MLVERDSQMVLVRNMVVELLFVEMSGTIHQWWAHLGRTFVKKTDKPEPESELLEIATNFVLLELSSSMSVAGDCAFWFAAANGMSACYNKTCLELKLSYVSSNKVRWIQLWTFTEHTREATSESVTNIRRFRDQFISLALVMERQN